MAQRGLLYLTVLVGLLGALVSYYQGAAKPPRPPPVLGRNNTVLFVVNNSPGLCNVHLATAFSLMEHHPEVEVHLASWEWGRIRDSLERLSAHAVARTPAAKPVVWHSLPGPDFFVASNKPALSVIAPPGLAGVKALVDDMQVFIAPWSGPDHLALRNHVQGLIREIEPAVTVLDMFVRPAMDAARDANRVHAILSPNVLADFFGGEQPWLAGLWKFPAIAAGHAFPVPWRDIPLNIYLTARFVYSLVMVPDLAEKRRFLKEHGVTDPINFFNIHQPDRGSFISQDTKGAAIPLDYVPPNVTTTGPITISVATAAEQDPELVGWMARAPTVLVNLGSFLEYDDDRARAMAGAIRIVLEKTDVQVLWKLPKPVTGTLSEKSWKPVVEELIESGRLRVSPWLTVDPTALLETGSIVLSVHHGGANCYHEAVATGVPHLIVPAWLDLYNYAALVETVGIGVWGNKKAAPGLEADELSAAMLKMVDSGPDSVAMREKAKRIAESLPRPGRDIAADEVAKLAATGY